MNENEMDENETKTWTLLGACLKPSEIAELYRIALTWVDKAEPSANPRSSVHEQAKLLVEAYIAGRASTMQIS